MGAAAREFLGSEKTKKRWVEDKVETWVVEVKHLEGFVTSFPHISYAGLKMSLQQQRQFVQHVTSGVGSFFSPL